MSKRRLIWILSAFLFSTGSDVFSQERSPIPVFLSGDEGHRTYRIPAIIRLPDKTLMAFAEGRVNSSDDFGNIDIVMKTSRDQGKTWSPMKTIVDVDSLQAGNPAPVVDRMDPRFPRGRIFLFYNTGNQTESEIRQGIGERKVWYITSADGGKTWDKPVNISHEVMPDQHAWRSYANTPGHALQVASGIFKGRLLIAANHSAGEPKIDFTDYSSHVFYTDDHGGHFHFSEDVPIPGSNEATATDLSNDRIMLNARDQKGELHMRIVAISSDGGSHWDTAYHEPQLPDPVCEGSILTIDRSMGHHKLAFCNAANTDQRNDLTIRFSKDDGMTWPEKKQIDRGGVESDDPTAYSDIVLLDPGNIGVLYEKDGYARIVFRSVSVRGSLK